MIVARYRALFARVIVLTFPMRSCFPPCSALRLSFDMKIVALKAGGISIYRMAGAGCRDVACIPGLPLRLTKKCSGSFAEGILKFNIMIAKTIDVKPRTPVSFPSVSKKRLPRS